jgi:hypothetical protein
MDAFSSMIYGRLDGQVAMGTGAMESAELTKTTSDRIVEAAKTLGVPTVMVFVLMAGIWVFGARVLDIGAKVADAHIQHMHQVGQTLEKIALRLDNVERHLVKEKK